MKDIAESIDREIVGLEEFEEITQDLFLNADSIEEEFENELLDHALHYAKIGYPVFPVHHLIKVGRKYRCSCKGWRTCKNQGKHPRTKNGYQDATDDENKIIAWWEEYPNANIGLVTGEESAIFVLDVDVDKGGEYSLEDLQDYHRAEYARVGKPFQPLPATLTTITGSGGRHL